MTEERTPLDDAIEYLHLFWADLDNPEMTGADLWDDYSRDKVSRYLGIVLKKVNVP